MIPALVQAEVPSRQYGVVHGLTAGKVIEMAGVKSGKGLRGLARIVSNRLRRFQAECGAPVKLAELGSTSAYVFDPLTSREWLDAGGRIEIERTVEERRRQMKFHLVPKRPA